jgi:hypothetical protein
MGMEAELVRCPGCGAENTAEAAFCADCGRRLRFPEEVKPKKRGLFGMWRGETPTPTEKPVAKAEVLEKKPKKAMKTMKTDSGEERAEEILKALQQFLLTNLPVPQPLKEPRELANAETITKYQVGLASVRIAKLGFKGYYLVTEPDITAEGKLAYALTLDSLFREGKLPAIETVRTPMRIGREAEKPETQTIDAMITSIIEKQLGRIGVSPSPNRVLEVKYHVNKNVFGYGPVDVPVNDPAVEDISCVGPRIPVMIAHRDYGHLHYLTSNIVFNSDDEVNDFMNRHAHRANTIMTLHKPYADFPLTDGSRFAGILGRELSAFGPTFTIRKWPIDRGVFQGLSR